MTPRVTNKALIYIIYLLVPGTQANQTKQKLEQNNLIFF